MKNKNVDILIVGAGASGAAAAWNLSSKNYKIVCLEQGPWLKKSSYSFDRPDWEKIKQKEFNINPNIRKLKSDYPIDNSHSPISVANYNAVGGSTILYSGHFPRFHPSDFKTKTLDGIGEDWPFDYKDLEPFYKINDKMMGVSGLSGDPAYPDIVKLAPPVPLGLAGEKIAKGFNKLGWHWWPAYSAISTKKYKKREENVRSTVDRCYWPKAISKGVELRTNSRVIKITLDKSGKANGVIYLDINNKQNFQKASMVILACSGVGTPRLLLNSANKYFSNGLANGSGLVGKNLMLHPLGYVEGKFNKFLGSFIGPEGCCIASQEFYETLKDVKHKRGYTMQVLRGSGPFETALLSRKFRSLQFGKNFHKRFLRDYGHSIPIAIICEDLPEKHNSVELDHKNKDTGGMPGVKINYKLSENSKKMLAHGISKAKEVMKVVGAKSIKAFGPVRHTGWHLMGTTKMGKSKKNSVVNQYGQTHEIKNLVIIDSSVFVTSGGVNPMSTLQAIALKITNEIKIAPNKYF
jgi:choline dehydrogenase-like flavoprotein